MMCGIEAVDSAAYVHVAATPFRILRSKSRSCSSRITCRIGRFEDYYEALGVSPSASQDTIKSAFRSLSRRYHPDVSRNPEIDRDRYVKVTVAYGILSDPVKRAQYDLTRGVQSGTKFLNDLEEMVSKTSLRDTSDTMSMTTKHKRTRSRGGMSIRTNATSSTYEQLSDLLSQARRASYSRSNVYMCGVCGASSSSSDSCDNCGVTSPSSLPDPRSQRQRYVTSIYSMHKAATPLDSERHHSLVHKNHISRDFHNKRAQLDIDAGNQQVWSAVTLGQVEKLERKDSFASKQESSEGTVVKSLKDKREEVSRLKSEIAVRELELRKLKELLQRAEMELQNETWSVSREDSQPSDVAELEDKLIICRLCGCHTMSSLRCDACGSDLQALAPSPSSHSGITKIYTMHKHGSTVLSKTDIHSLVHLHHFSSDPSAEAKAESKLSERTVEEWEVLVRQELQLVRAHLREGQCFEGSGEDRQMKTNFTFGVFSSVRPHETPAVNSTMVEKLTNEEARDGLSVQRMKNNVADLRFFVSHLKACAKRMRSEADRAAVRVREMEVKAETRPASQDTRERTLQRPMQRLPVRCMCCGCDSLSADRCDCCGEDCCGLSGKEVFPHEAQLQRKSSIFGVYTMHGSTATQLDQEDRHNLVHTNHFSQVDVDSSPFLEREFQAPADQARWGLRSAGRAEKTARDKEAELKQACKSCVELEEAMLLKNRKDEQVKELSDAHARKLEARQLLREADALDVIIARHIEELNALQERVSRVENRDIEQE